MESNQLSLVLNLIPPITVFFVNRAPIIATTHESSESLTSFCGLRAGRMFIILVTEEYDLMLDNGKLLAAQQA